MQEIVVTLPDEKQITIPAGTPFSFLAPHFNDTRTLAAVRVNNKMLPLCEKADITAKIEPVFLESDEGASIYRHTLSFILCAAAKKALPERLLRVGHSLGNTYYFSFFSGSLPAENDILLLKNAIDNYIKDNLPVEKKVVSFHEAAAYFKDVQAKETVQLLEQCAASHIALNVVGQYNDLYTGPLLPKTGLLTQYALTLYKDGFLLHFPVLKNGKLELAEPRNMDKIFFVFSESKKWARIAGVDSVSQLNALVAQREIKDFIRITEAFAEKKLSHIADMIYTRREWIKFITIAGPSSSGKTTTAKRLAIHLKTMGIHPVIISLDDYYLHPDLVPKDEKGDPDFECLESLDIKLLNEHLVSLLNGQEVALPVFDFKTGTRREGKHIKLKRRMMLLLEGIHGLNDALTPDIPAEQKFKFYLSALTQINLDDHTRIATSDNRLLRRLVRDYQFRGLSARRTLSMWPDVQRGAEKHVFTFQNNADAVFNSALGYEIAVLKLFAEPLLYAVTPDCANYSEAARLLDLLGKFSPIPSEYVPPLSVLREFIGGSDFKY